MAGNDVKFLSMIRVRLNSFFQTTVGMAIMDGIKFFLVYCLMSLLVIALYFAYVSWTLNPLEINRADTGSSDFEMPNIDLDEAAIRFQRILDLSAIIPWQMALMSVFCELPPRRFRNFCLSLVSVFTVSCLLIYSKPIIDPLFDMAVFLTCACVMWLSSVFYCYCVKNTKNP